MRSAAKFHSEARNGHRNAAALSLAGSLASSSRSRSGSVAAFFAISSAGSAGLAAGGIRTSQIEHQPHFFSVRAATLLVEALPGLVAQPAALHHLVQNRGKAALRHALGKVRGHMGQNVDAHQVGQPEGSGARPADRRAGQRVHFFDGQPLLQHQVRGA